MGKKATWAKMQFSVRNYFVNSQHTKMDTSPFAIVPVNNILEINNINYIQSGNRTSPGIFSKLWLIQEIMSGRSTAKQMSTRYNLKIWAVNSYVRKFKKRGFVKGNIGRPAGIDEKGLENLVEYVQLEKPGETLLKYTIREEHEQTIVRRCGEDHQIAIKRFSQRSVGRYLNKIYAIVDS